MIEFILGLVVGLVVGWNLLPQPLFIERYLSKFK